MGWASAVQAGVENFVGGIQMYVNQKAQAKTAKRNAKAAEAQAAAQAAAYAAQAKGSTLQAAIAQRQGEVEAEKRFRVMAQDIGSVYANASGNGLMVDGSGKDTVGDILKTTADEAEWDINTIRENAAMNVWTYLQQAKAHSASASATLMSGKYAADEYRRQFKAAKASSKHGLMQSISGVPAGVWQAAGVDTFHKFGGIWGGHMAIPMYGGGLTGYAIQKQV